RLRHALAEVHKQQEAIRLRRVEAQTRLEGFEAMLTGTYALDFEEAAAEVGTTDAEKIETIKGALAQGRRRLSELGPVNVMAIDEHREMEERLRFLTAQDQDLTQSVASLKLTRHWTRRTPCDSRGCCANWPRGPSSSSSRTASRRWKCRTRSTGSRWKSPASLP